MLTAIVGINWGDEGKGRMVDLLSRDYDIVARYQGGNNAGHTVVNDKGHFVLNLLPSGILREDTLCVMGTGMVIDIEFLCSEIERLEDKGIFISEKNLMISDRAMISMPYHKMRDILEEERLADAKYGSTRRGIGPAYSDKYIKKGLRMGDLLHEDTLMAKVEHITQWENLLVRDGYRAEALDSGALYAWLIKYSARIKPLIKDTTTELTKANREGRSIMFEAQLGALRDIDYGIYPYTSSSSTIAAYAPIGAGIPGAKLDRVTGIMKAYSSCVGEGPFTVEYFGPEADALREAGGEYGAATGRPRRVGPFDAVASRFGALVQGATELALTKLDVLSYMDTLPICVAYEIDGRRSIDFPEGDDLLKAKPVYEYLPGFKCDISACRSIADLPSQALDYIRYLERAVDCPIKYVSVGAERESYITMY